MTPAFNVLFLCTHNSARSIMAEAILEEGRQRSLQRLLGRVGAGRGADAGGDRAARGMSATTCQSSARKSWNEFMGPSAPRMDFVITLCDTIDGQTCPDFGEQPVTAAVAVSRSRQNSRAPTSSARLC